LTIAGALRVDGSGSTQPVSGTVAVTQSTSPWVDNLTQVAGVVLGATAVTAFGTAPAAANVPGVNSSLFAGTTGITATGTSLNVNITNAAGPFTLVGNKSNNAVVPGATNLGVLPAIANAATQTWTEGDQVLESVDLSGRQRVRGTIAHNTQAPDATGQMALTELANAVAPTYTEGDLVLGSVDLSGNRRVIGTKTNNNAAPTTQIGVLSAIANAASPSWTEGNQVLESVDLTGRQRIRGTLTNNNAAPAADGTMTLSALANAAAPTWTEGDVVLLSEDLSGRLRVLTTPAAGAVTTVAGNLTNNNAAPAATEVGVLPALANAVAPLWTEGDQVLESVDLHGGQRTICGNIPEVTAAWTSATGSGTTLQINTLGYSTITASFNSGAVGGASLIFEVSDTTAFTNAYTIAGVETVATVAAILVVASVTAGAIANTNVSVIFNVAGWAAFRVRTSGAITGAGTINVGLAATPATTSQPTISIRANTNAAAAGDNNLNSTMVPDSGAVLAPLGVGDFVYGGKFSGAADATRQGWSKRRTPTVFKTAQATASGNTAVWTPGAGNKFRLLKLFVEVTDNASLAAGAVLTIDIRDANVSTNITFDVFVPTTAVTTTIGDGLEQELDLGDFGILSSAANNVLNVNLSAALVTGNCRIIAMGTEE